MTERYAGPSVRLLAPPGGPVQTIVKANPREVLPSKRVPLIENQEGRLEEMEVVLDEGTRRRNREFKRRMDAVMERQGEWKLRLEREEEDRDKEHKQVTTTLEEKLKDATDSIWLKIKEDFSVFHELHIPPLEKRMTAHEADFDHFVNVTVPRKIDECSETIARKVEKARETFTIENTKVLKREEKIVERFCRHVGNTTQGIEDEEATRVSKLRLLAEEIDEPERVDERAEEKRIMMHMQSILEIREMIKAEEEERAREDGMVLDEMLRTQEKLQKSVLENFGAD